MSEAASRPHSGIIALEAATEAGGVALLDGSRLLAQQSFDEAQRSASTLLVTLDELLQRVGRELDDFQLIALSIGPGSFTGLRVGLAMALGLCFDTERRVVPVATLAALSMHARGAAHIVPMLDARRGEVYTGLYGPDGNELQEDRVTDPSSWVRSLTDTGDRLHFVGSGALRYAGVIQAIHGDRARILSADQSRPCAASVGLLGARLAEAGGSLPGPEVELRYLRRPQAELSRRAGHPPDEPIS